MKLNFSSIIVEEVKLHLTTPDLHISVGLITAGFVRTGSDVPSLPVMSLKIKK